MLGTAEAGIGSSRPPSLARISGPLSHMPTSNGGLAPDAVSRPITSALSSGVKVGVAPSRLRTSGPTTCLKPSSTEPG
jgi:hypothetical protein